MATGSLSQTTDDATIARSGSPTNRWSNRKASPLPRGARLFLTGKNRRRSLSSGSEITRCADRAAATKATEPIKRWIAAVPAPLGW